MDPLLATLGPWIRAGGRAAVVVHDGVAAASVIHRRILAFAPPRARLVVHRGAHPIVLFGTPLVRRAVAGGLALGRGLPIWRRASVP